MSGPAEPQLPDPELPDPAGRPPGREHPHGWPVVQEAWAADASVVPESGRWVVYLDVVLESGAVRRRVGDYPDERRAQTAARIIERNARRHIPAAGFREAPDDRRPDQPTDGSP
ncbi:MAG: hypothetical protein R2737_06510 [Candidatus Nanopelagicales bacterium]